MTTKTKELETNENAEASEVSDQTQQVENDLTKVKVRFTNIKYFNEDENTVKEMMIIGKLSMPECKKMVKDVEGKNVLISKDNVNEEFNVRTVELYALKMKQPESL